MQEGDDEKMADLTVDQELKDFIDIIAADFDETAKKIIKLIKF